MNGGVECGSKFNYSSVITTKTKEFLTTDSLNTNSLNLFSMVTCGETVVILGR